MTLSRPIGIDLFAGAGGLSLGFEQAGFDVPAAVEIDPIHCAIHEFNFPCSTAICASVVDLTGDAIRRRAGIGDREIDVVFGGAPCQGFSLIGKRALDDPRNQLVFHYVRLVRELQPNYCVFENVPGLTVGQHQRFLRELIEAFQEAGYDVLLPYRVLNAADFGVPQDRRRLFLIGAKQGLPLPAYPAPTGRTTVAEAIDDLPDADRFQELLASDSVAVSFDTVHPYARRLRGLESDPADYSHPRSFDPSRLTSSLRTEHTELSRRRFNQTPQGKVEPVSRFHRLAPHGLCNTLRAGTDSARGAFTSPRPIHYRFPRVITVREAARLHSYPDWFRFHATKWHGFREIGNSVPPLLGRAVAGEIMKALGCSAEKPEKSLLLGHDSESLLKFDMSEAAAHFGVPANTIAQRTRNITPRERAEKQQVEMPDDLRAHETRARP
ncbi:MAG: DNA cytosine methyltransferase [Candidatus Competibacteraceae bacterium]